MTMFDLLPKSQANYNADAVRRAMRLAKESNAPTSMPTTKLTSQPKNQPTNQPKSQPTSQPKNQPTNQPKSQPTSQPKSQPKNKSKSSQGGLYKEMFKTGSQQEVQKVVESNKVVVFAKTYCPYCKKAKKLLESLGVEFLTIELDELGELGKTVQESLEEMTSQSTVPSVFANQEHLGGSDDLAKLVESDNTYFERL